MIRVHYVRPTIGLGGSPPFQLAAAGEPFHVCSPMHSALRVIHTGLACWIAVFCTPAGSSVTVQIPAAKGVSFDPAWQLPANNPCWERPSRQLRIIYLPSAPETAFLLPRILYLDIGRS